LTCLTARKRTRQRLSSALFSHDLSREKNAKTIMKSAASLFNRAFSSYVAAAT